MSGLINLETQEGQKLIVEASQKSQYQPFLHSIFCKQKGPATCGIASSALLLCAAELGKKHPIPTGVGQFQADANNLPMNERKLLDSPATQAVKTEEMINSARGGLTLEEVADVLKANGLRHKVYLASATTVSEFRDVAREALRNQDSAIGVNVNYHMETLGQEKFFGHHSPLGAYHEETDRFLIFDTWNETHECWAKTEDLFKAMQVVDDASGKTRGFLVVYSQ